MAHILLSGFTPFDGRACNASWIAARLLTLEHHQAHILHCLRIPVCWNAAWQAIPAALERWQPQLVIAMGEGERGVFRLETLARNTRKARLDNAQRLPPQEYISASGPQEYLSSAPCATVQKTLTREGIPIELSRNAGAYLCEEALYTLEHGKTIYPFVNQVFFVHLPPYGSVLHYRGEARICDEKLLSDFGSRLLDAVLADLKS